MPTEYPMTSKTSNMPPLPTFWERAEILERKRTLKMARSAHAFVRGNTLQHYQWLREIACDFPDGPSVWICGDCHAGNLGPIADSHGHVDIQIRDLDQTVIGNPTHDLVRLALSLASAARGSDTAAATLTRRERIPSVPGWV